MNIWVEYYKFSDDRKNNHAQMKENAKWVPPDPSIIHRRFFDKIVMLEFLQNVWKRMEIWCQSREMGVY